MASIRLSLRAAVLFAILAVGEVSAVHHDTGASSKKHRRVKRGHGRCSHHTSSSLILSSSIPSSTTPVDVGTSSIESSSIESLPTFSPSSSILTSTSLSIPTAEPSSSTTPLSSSTLTSTTLATSTAEPSSASPSASSSWTLPSSTSAVPSSSEIPVSSAASSSTLVTSTTSVCEPTVTTWAPELCWRTIPARCNSMTVTTYAPATLTGHINACTSALRGYDNQLAPGIAGCFENIGQPAFVATSAFSCVSSAPVYCASTTACAPSSTSQPIIPAYTNGGFESGSFGAWALTPPTTPDNIIGSISTEQVRTGSYSLKLQSNNLATTDTTAWSHRVRLEPAGRYEFSFWYYSMTNQARGTLSIRADLPGTGIPLVIQMASQPVGRWIQQKITLTPSTSFGTVVIGYLSERSSTGVSNVVYIDDVTVTKVG